MKKQIILALAFSLSAVMVMAKTPKSDKQYTPEAGDISIGISADPLLNYMGNLLNGNYHNDIDSDAIGGEPVISNPSGYTYPSVSIIGRYMLTDKFGVRANIGILMKNNTTQYYATDDAALLANPLSNQKVVDSYKSKASGASISAVGEYRIGDKRIQGVFTGGLLYAYQRYSQSYEYGNAMTEANQKPSSDMAGYFGTENTTLPNSGMAYARLTETSNDGANYLGLTTSAGVEWFFAQKVSLGFEVSLVAIYGWKGATYKTYEGYNTVNGKVESFTDLTSPSQSSFEFGTENIGSNLTVNFYF